MLPENEFHTAPIPVKPQPNNSKWYTTNDVLGLTKMSRFTLIRKTKEEDFPRPIKINNKENRYAKKDVDAWIKENEAFIEQRNPNKVVTLTLTPKQYAHLKSSAKLLECNIETFVMEAAVFKSNQVKKMSQSKYFEDSFIV